MALNDLGLGFIERWRRRLKVRFDGTLVYARIECDVAGAVRDGDSFVYVMGRRRHRIRCADDTSHYDVNEVLRWRDWLGLVARAVVAGRVRVNGQRVTMHPMERPSTWDA